MAALEKMDKVKITMSIVALAAAAVSLSDHGSNGFENTYNLTGGYSNWDGSVFQKN
jgi:rhodanese-related sulfurtransferase